MKAKESKAYFIVTDTGQIISTFSRPVKKYAIKYFMRAEYLNWATEKEIGMLKMVTWGQFEAAGFSCQHMIIKPSNIEA